MRVVQGELQEAGAPVVLKGINWFGFNNASTMLDVHFFAHNGFFVLIDNHLREDQTALQDSNRWAQEWAQLVADLVKDHITSSHLLIDVLNEPDNYGIRWEAGNGKPGLADLYLLAMDAIHQVAPDVPFFLEGTGQSGIGANWGDGFATDARLIRDHGLSDPNTFFQALMTKPYAHQVVICPHVYGPAVTHSSQGATGQGLFQRLLASFGHLTQQGFQSPQGQMVFPVAVGEFGSKFEESQDIQAMQDLASYLGNVGAGADGQHAPIPHWFYWSWNANSGDTGGIVADDWTSIHWKKIDYLISCGLRPWYLDNTNPGASPSSAPQPKHAPTLTPPGTTPQAPYVLAQQQQQPNQPAGQQQAWAYPGKISGQNAVVKVGQPWQSSPGRWQCDVNITLINKGHSTIQTPWHLSVHCKTWQSLASGAETKIGCVVECQRNSITSDDFTPDTVLLNGMPCFVSKE
ncbi:hypothetical protein WJX79_005360 [Trebouxia sp. C0005]